MPKNRHDPYLSFRFRVEVDNIIVAHVSEVSGLQIDIETEPYREGGVNDFVHSFPKGIKYQPLVLKRGISDPDFLWTWIEEVRTEKKITRKSVTIVLMDQKGTDILRWAFKGVYPIKWSGPMLKADSNTIAFESIEFVHSGMIYSK